MPIQAGDTLPQATLKRRTSQGMEEVRFPDFLAGKRVVLFGVPGAFTPTCSDTHLPGFLLRGQEIKAKGVDAIVCVAVNDPFVMEAWGKARDVGDEILLLSDGNGELARAMDLVLDATAHGMGLRFRRFAAVVRDGVVETLYVEPAGGVTVSGAESVLQAL